jgi:hypothetical protein
MKRCMMNAAWEARIGKDESFLYKLVNVPGKQTEFNRQFKSAVQRAVHEKKDMEMV